VFSQLYQSQQQTLESEPDGGFLKELSNNLAKKAVEVEEAQPSIFI